MLFMERSISAVVGGRVQGVGYRYSTQRVGTELGLAGWVRNRPDGTVEVWAQGNNTEVDLLVEFLGDGPPGCRVTSLIVSDTDPDPDLSRFGVRW